MMKRRTWFALLLCLCLVLLAGCAYVAVTLLVDIVSMLLNPRVRLGGKRL